MKTQFKKFALLTASLMIFSAPVLADESMMVNSAAEPEQQMGGKKQCLLAANSCTGSVDSLTGRISKIQNEISKGTSVYTYDELRQLQKKLDEEIIFLNDEKLGG